LGARIRAGRATSWITWAMVKVLPEPVTPRSTWSRSSLRKPWISSSIAWGWSPAGWNSEVSRNGRLASFG
jgi:hypothetical protein